MGLGGIIDGVKNVVNRAVDVVGKAVEQAKAGRSVGAPDPVEQNRDVQQHRGQSSFEVNDLVYRPSEDKPDIVKIGTRNSTNGTNDEPETMVI